MNLSLETRCGNGQSHQHSQSQVQQQSSPCLRPDSYIICFGYFTLLRALAWSDKPNAHWFVELVLVKPKLYQVLHSETAPRYITQGQQNFPTEPHT